MFQVPSAVFFIHNQKIMVIEHNGKAENGKSSNVSNIGLLVSGVHCWLPMLCCCTLLYTLSCCSLYAYMEIRKYLKFPYSLQISHFS